MAQWILCALILRRHNTVTTAATRSAVHSGELFKRLSPSVYTVAMNPRLGSRGLAQGTGPRIAMWCRIGEHVAEDEHPDREQTGSIEGRPIEG